MRETLMEHNVEQREVVADAKLLDKERDVDEALVAISTPLLRLPVYPQPELGIQLLRVTGHQRQRLLRICAESLRIGRPGRVPTEHKDLSYGVETQASRLYRLGVRIASLFGPLANLRLADHTRSGASMANTSQTGAHYRVRQSLRCR